MSDSSLLLRASAVPDRLPIDRICDVDLQLALCNQGREAIEIYPGAAKLAAIASFAGMGFTWSLALIPQNGDAALPLLELRRWYGPPGNPPSPAYAKQLGVTLAPGAEHVERQLACWIPNARFAPEHLAPAVLDPQGMDNIAARSWTPPPGYPVPPPLQDRFPLARASVLVFGASAVSLEAAMREQADFLRGHVVAFVPDAGTYDLHVEYAQSSWMGLGKSFQVRATPVRLHAEA
jgi:hypothetical protein